MAETGTMEIDGQKMKLCPGWEGNSFRCGRGSPRLIRADADVCENCSRGMRKRGQKTREEEERAARERAAYAAKIQRGVEAVLPVFRETPNAPEDLAKLVVALETMQRGVLEPPDEWGERYYHRERIWPADRWSILRVLAGLEPKDE